MTTMLHQEILQIPDALANTLEQGAFRIRSAAEALRLRSPRQIILVGGGTSYCAAVAACAHGRALAGPAGPVIWASPGGDFLASPPPLGDRDVVIAISASGETRDLLAVCDVARQALVIGLTNEPDSSLVRCANETILTFAGQQQIPSTRKTFVASVIALHALWVKFFNYPEPALAQAANVAQATLTAFDGPMETLAAKLVGCHYTCVFGTGPSWAVAQEAALKLKEIAELTAEGAETRELVQGILPIIGPGTAAIAVAPPGSGTQMTIDALAHCRELGAVVQTIGPLSKAWPALLAGVQYIIPFYLLCVHLARQRGLDADNPAWRERYYRIMRM
jgi:glucosamine--fructose-6-phosphate aminotransferase (isomerizing)